VSVTSLKVATVPVAESVAIASEGGPADDASSSTAQATAASRSTTAMTGVNLTQCRIALLALTPDAVVVAVEPVRVGRNYLEAAIGYLAAVQIRGSGGDADRWVRRMTVARCRCDGCRSWRLYWRSSCGRGRRGWGWTKVPARWITVIAVVAAGGRVEVTISVLIGGARIPYSGVAIVAVITPAGAVAVTVPVEISDRWLRRWGWTRSWLRARRWPFRRVW
jgi:hypothetical protein